MAKTKETFYVHTLSNGLRCILKRVPTSAVCYCSMTIGAGSRDEQAGEQGIAHLVRGVAQHQNHLLAAAGNAAQADGKTVTGQDGENNTDGLAAQLGADILGNGIDGCVVTLRTCNDSLRHSDDITVTDRKSV